MLAKASKCTICTSSYRHRNLHCERLTDQTLSPFEMDLLPALWRDALYKNPAFCEHVCHSWMCRALKREQLRGTVSIDTNPDLELVSKDGERLFEFIDGVVQHIGNRQQVSDCSQVIEQYMTQQGWIAKKSPSWWVAKKKKIPGSVVQLADSLVDQFIAQLELEDVHEREVRLLVWKHFILALVHTIKKRMGSPLATADFSGSIEANSPPVPAKSSGNRA